ncbi:hypothetical protein RAY_177 [Erwinia phage vB_EamM_RAY]|uniref:Uncharacterized protein n=10 Tax=Agricanvirus TaxID=1984776 RepID=A0A173GES8_9CAUD|nr:hypothetical protein Ea357_175 [Erwinia phage Ea35-70]YP_009605326.1 hypothetical protein FDH97_gp183 [Erwinia phage vB_EamM_Deimos-Minion]YP_009605644.1 hypothetical protein FDH98_gp177 [Erwinia phage vB_EamM_RAY]YP_009605964.1 hypothetical protein FDH99_gp180 [Erwinia phage vB_EamM_Simmy50]YP_009606285.1 hypothetical protein FDI00_gp179 [Erwinia phage vB_EamM_Special G]YP_009621919.1 hypothetical protein FDJ23_gp178 [Erwinia phage vB_EamM_Desertfox]AUG85966.1 hypothetical protein BOSOLAP
MSVAGSILAWINNQIDRFADSQEAQVWTAIIVLFFLCLLVSELRTVRQTEKFENGLRLLIGKYNLYSPEDVESLNQRGYDLFELYVESLTECNIPVYDREREEEEFMKGFFHGYVIGRRVMAKVHPDPRVVECFEKKFYKYLGDIR